jgi:hypothetical protein
MIKAFIVSIEIQDRRNYRDLSRELNGDMRPDRPQSPIFSETIPHADGDFRLLLGQYFVRGDYTKEKLLKASKTAAERLLGIIDLKTDKTENSSFSVMVIEIANLETSISSYRHPKPPHSSL